MRIQVEKLLAATELIDVRLPGLEPDDCSY
jgi:hypothetical protein